MVKSITIMYKYSDVISSKCNGVEAILYSKGITFTEFTLIYQWHGCFAVLFYIEPYK